MEVTSPHIEITREGFRIIVFSGESDPLVEDDDNVDVQIDFEDGRRYTGTFFTLMNLHTLFAKNKDTGECSSGLYFFCTDMIVVEKLDQATIARVVEELIANEELDSVFDLQEL